MIAVYSYWACNFNLGETKLQITWRNVCKHSSESQRDGKGHTPTQTSLFVNKYLLRSYIINSQIFPPERAQLTESTCKPRYIYPGPKEQLNNIWNPRQISIFNSNNDATVQTKAVLRISAMWNSPERFLGLPRLIFPFCHISTKENKLGVFGCVKIEIPGRSRIIRYSLGLMRGTEAWAVPGRSSKQ